MIVFGDCLSEVHESSMRDVNHQFAPSCSQDLLPIVNRDGRQFILHHHPS